MIKTRSRLSWIVLSIGVAVTLLASFISYIFPQSPSVNSALVAGLVGIVLTVALDLRAKIGEVEEQMSIGSSEASTRKRVMDLRRKDKFYLQRYDELKQEMDELANGTYRIRTLNDLYLDDIRSINELRKGEHLLSTCPVSTVSKTAAADQLSDPHYKASMEAHRSASMRGVRVTRIYLFRSEDFAIYEPIMSHLVELVQSKMEILILLRDEAKREGPFDFLVFGDRKVSVGEVNPDTGVVSSARVHSDPEIVKSYKREYRNMKLVSIRLEELISRVSAYPHVHEASILPAEDGGRRRPPSGQP